MCGCKERREQRMALREQRLQERAEARKALAEQQAASTQTAQK